MFDISSILLPDNSFLTFFNNFAHISNTFFINTSDFSRYSTFQLRHTAHRSPKQIVFHKKAKSNQEVPNHEIWAVSLQARLYRSINSLNSCSDTVSLLCHSEEIFRPSETKTFDGNSGSIGIKKFPRMCL